MNTVRNNQVQTMAENSPGTQMIVPCDPHWIEFRLVDKDNNPVPGEKYRVVMPDQSIKEGTLDGEGKVRFEGILGGQAQISFPGIDANEWFPLEEQ